MASARGRSLQWSAKPTGRRRTKAKPRAFPRPAQISRLSAICSPMSISRLPPNAPRTASSLRRAALRATSRFETLRQAISSMHPTAHNRHHQWGLHILGHIFQDRPQSSLFRNRLRGMRKVHLILQRASPRSPQLPRLPRAGVAPPRGSDACHAAQTTSHQKSRHTAPTTAPAHQDT